MSNGGDEDFEDFLPEITDDTIDTVWIDPETGVTWPAPTTRTSPRMDGKPCDQ